MLNVNLPSRITIFRALMTLGIGVVLLFIWQLAYDRAWASHLVLPAPLDVVQATVTGISSGVWLPHLGTTVTEALAGFVIGVLLAIGVGAVFAFLDTIRIAFYPYILAAQTFPKIAIAPLLVTWLGYGLAPKIVIAAVLAFFPVFVNTVQGLRELDKDQLLLFQSLRASAFQEFRFLRLPSALSYVFPALTLSAVFSLLGAIVGEFVGANSGLGYLVQQLSFQGDLGGVYGVLFILAIIGLIVYGALRALENHVRFTH